VTLLQKNQDIISEVLYGDFLSISKHRCNTKTFYIYIYISGCYCFDIVLSLLIQIDKEDDINDAAIKIARLTRTVTLWPGDLKRTTENLLPKLRNIAKSKIKKGGFSKSKIKEEMEKLSQVRLLT